MGYKEKKKSDPSFCADAWGGGLLGRYFCLWFHMASFPYEFGLNSYLGDLEFSLNVTALVY
jgi:hypothetical protein